MSRQAELEAWRKSRSKYYPVEARVTLGRYWPHVYSQERPKPTFCCVPIGHEQVWMFEDEAAKARFLAWCADKEKNHGPSIK